MQVRLRIRRCDILVGDVTPVGNVAMKGKMLPNGNVMYGLGIASEAMTAERVLPVANIRNVKEDAGCLMRLFC